MWSYGQGAEKASVGQGRWGETLGMRVGWGGQGPDCPVRGAVEGSRRTSRGCYVKRVWRPKVGGSEDVAAGVQAALGGQR